MKLAVIPARGGSKRIPRKNLKEFCGKPIIGWSIEAALQSGCFDEVIVSTDDGEIAEVARRLGAATPFMRPAALADDYAGTVPVIRHAVEWYRDHRTLPEAACCIYATAPFVRAEDLQRGLAALQENRCSYAFSVTNYPFPVQRAIRITGQGRIAMLHPEHLNTRSQDLEDIYHDAGQFYWGSAAAWLAGAPIYGPESTSVLLPRYRVQDIDTPDDWLRAELMFRALQTLSQTDPTKAPA